jgi:hypothetical protein
VIGFDVPMARTEFAFTSVVVQPERVMEFTGDGTLVGAGIQKLGRRGAQPGGHQKIAN